MERSTFLILVRSRGTQAMGSGFLAADGLVVTNGHLLGDYDGTGGIYVLNKHVRPMEASVAGFEYSRGARAPGSRDLALLRLKGKPQAGLKPLAFSLDVANLDWVSAWGFPSLITGIDSSHGDIMRGRLSDRVAPPVSSTSGSITSIVHGPLGDMIVHSAQISRGSSGGPLVNWKGEVVGINTWDFAEEGETPSAYLAQPASEIVGFLASNGVRPALAGGQGPPQGGLRPAPEGPEGAPPPKRGGKADPRDPGTGPPPRKGGKADPRDPGPAPPPKRGGGAAGPSPKPENDGRDGRPGMAEKVSLDGASFSIPESWVIDWRDDSSATLASGDGTVAMVFLTEDNGGHGIGEIAGIYSESVQGTTPELANGVWTFSYKEAGGDAYGVVQGLPKGRHLIYCVSGDYGNADVAKILGTLRLE
jgi:hypothetical protein